MSDFQSRLKTLASMESTYPHVLSVYLRLREGNQDTSRAADIFVRNRASEIESVLSGDSRAQTFLQRELKALEHILEQDLPKGAHGLALFLRNGDVVDRFETPFEFDNQLAYRRVPHIAQLAFMDEELEPFLIVALDSRNARIFDLTLGVLSGQGEVSTDVHRRIHSGGWSQMRFQRRIDNQKREHLEDVSKQISEIIERFNHKRIMIVGPDKTTSQLMELLPKKVSQRVIERKALDSKASEKDIIEESLQYFARAEDAEEVEKIRRARIEIHSTRMAVAGIDQVLKYLTRGQAYEILLSPDFNERGVECSACGGINHGQAGSVGKCPSCDATNGSLKDVDLREFITRTSINYGIKLEFVKHPDFKRTLGNAAAMLYSPAGYKSGRFPKAGSTA